MTERREVFDPANPAQMKPEQRLTEAAAILAADVGSQCCRGRHRLLHNSLSGLMPPSRSGNGLHGGSLRQKGGFEAMKNREFCSQVLMGVSVKSVAGAWTYEQDVVPAGGGDGDRSLDRLLPADL